MKRSMWRTLPTQFQLKFALVLLGLAWITAANASQAVALSDGKPYFLLPAPSYWGCTDAGDAIQLTDGQLSRGHWLDPACVGWSEGGQDVAILIDLVESTVFDTVDVSTLQGQFAGVPLPQTVAVYASDDGEVFRQIAHSKAGEYNITKRIRNEQEPGRFSEHLTLRHAGIPTVARYILVTMARGNFLFIDEVSVRRITEDKPVEAAGPVLTNHQITAQYLGVPRVFDPDIEPFVTPHWSLAKQLAGGPIDALIVTPASTARDIEELQQRLQLDPEIIATDEGPAQSMNGLLEVRIRQLLDAAPPEVLLLSGTDWSKLGAPLRAGIVERISQGMGLVVVDPKMNLQQLRDLGLNASATAEPYATHLRNQNDTIQLQLGAGRVVLIDHRGKTDHATHTLIPPPNAPLGSLTTPKPLDDEYAYSRVARAIHWAAGRGPSGQDIPLRRIDFTRGSLAIEHVPAGRVRLEIRDRFNALLHTDEISLDGQSSTAHFALPTLPGPTLNALVQAVNSSGDIEAWLTVPLEQDLPMSISSLNVPKSIAGPKGSFATMVQVDRPSRDPSDTLHLMLVDTYGRVIYDQRHALTVIPEMTVDLNHPALITRTAEVRAVIERGGEAIDERRGTVLVQTPKHSDSGYRMDFWTGANPMVMRYHADGIYKQTRQLGGDALFATWPMDELCNLAAMNNMSTVPENILRIYPEDGSNATDRVPTLGTGDFNERLSNRISQALVKYEPYGIELASLGDECSYATSPDADRSPEAMALFRAWLKDRFETIQQLNDAYGLQLASFAEAVPPLTEEAKSSGTPGLWLAHREFAVHQFSSTLKHASSLFKDRHPDTPFGISGSQLPGPSNGHDYAQLADDLDAISAYGALQRELLRSFAKPGHMHTVWSGFDYGGTNERMERYNLWQSLMQGFKGIALFHQFEQRAHSLYSSGYIGPDLRPHRRAVWAADTVATIRRLGLGHLTAQAQPMTSSVRVLYSTRSMMMMSVAPISAQGYAHGATLYLDSVGGLCAAMRDLQRPYQLLDESHLEADAPTSAELIYVPAAVSLSDRALTNLRKFAEAGGTVIVEPNVGKYDAYGKTRSSAQIAKLLGTLPKAGDTLEPTRMLNPQRLTVGKGAVVTLEGSLFDYEPTTVGGAGGELVDAGGSDLRRSELRAMLDDVMKIGPPRNVEAVNAEGQREVWAELFPMSAAEGYRFVGLLGAYDQPGLISEEDRQALELLPASTGVAYELTQQQVYASSDQIEFSLAPGEARFFAFLPVEVDSVELNAGDLAGEVSLDVRVTLLNGHPAGAHAVRIEVTDPLGRVRPEYGGIFAAPRGEAKHSFRPALNDPVGEWVIVVYDTISGKSGRATARPSAQ